MPQSHVCRVTLRRPDVRVAPAIAKPLRHADGKLFVPKAIRRDGAQYLHGLGDYIGSYAVPGEQGNSECFRHQ